MVAHDPGPVRPRDRGSGIGDTGYHAVCWYEREFELPPLPEGAPEAHTNGGPGAAVSTCTSALSITAPPSGSTANSPPATRAATRRSGRRHRLARRRTAPRRVTVRAEDDPHDLSKPRGKQDWQLEPHSIWYPRTTGIWQTVWVERVPRHLDRQDPLDAERRALGDRVRGAPRRRTRRGLRAQCQAARRRSSARRRHLRASSPARVHRRIALSDPGIDDYRNELLWSPEPDLIEVEMKLWGGRRACSIESESLHRAPDASRVQGDRFVLNGRPYLLRLVLDQGYWPDTLLTAPDDEALRRDVELAKAMGFNGVRKHQKIEAPRYLYWADHLGLLVWEEMPSAYRFTHRAIERLTREWTRPCSSAT